MCHTNACMLHFYVGAWRGFQLCLVAHDLNQVSESEFPRLYVCMCSKQQSFEDVNLGELGLPCFGD